GGSYGHASAQATSYASSLKIRTGEVLESVALTPIMDIGLLSPMALGALAARHRLLEDVGLHADLLRPLARWGLGIGLIGAIPLTVVLIADPHHLILTSQTVLGILWVSHRLTAVPWAGGAAARAAPVGRRIRGPLLRASEARAAMDLTAYIAQCLVVVCLMPAFSLGLGARLGTAGASA